MSSNKTNHVFTGNDPESLRALAIIIEKKSLANPKQARLISGMLEDPDCNRLSLFNGAFCMGVISTLLAIQDGNLRLAREPEADPNLN
jgi:hypothetical protein